MKPEQEKRITTSSFNMKYWEERYLKGKVTNDEWSRMTVAMRVHLNRYLKKNKNKVTIDE